MASNGITATAEQLAANLAAIERYKVTTTELTSLSNGFRNNDYVLFPRQYYSGSDATFSFGNVVVDEIVDLSVAMAQQVQPLYGYASHTYDAVMTGNRLVSGSFKINFKETFFLQSILEKILQNSMNTAPLSRTDYHPLNSAAIDTDITLNQLSDKIRNLAASEIADLAEAYEKRLWPSSSNKIDKSHQSMLLNPFGGFDYFTGDGWVSAYNKLMRDGFDIVISHGGVLTEVKTNPSADTEGTVKVINGVHITGVSTIYQPTGDPIYEEYSFIARDMNDSIKL